jgi:hypothetical protein
MPSSSSLISLPGQKQQRDGACAYALDIAHNNLIEPLREYPKFLGIRNDKLFLGITVFHPKAARLAEQETPFGAGDPPQ